MPILGIWASQISGHLWAPAGAYDALATVTVPSGGIASVTFAGIPTGYKHLQIRGMWMGAGSSYVKMYFNGDTTGANYYSHGLLGNGSAASSFNLAGSSFPGILMNAGSSPAAGNLVTNITDVLDYANTAKTKTVRTLTGWDANGTGAVELDSGVYLQTTAVTSITLTLSGGNFNQNSSLALYGVK